MNHVAFNVDKRDIEGYRNRIKKSKMSPYVSPILYHADNSPSGYVSNPNDDRISWRSFYFFGPDGEYLELTSQERVYGQGDVKKNVLHLPRKALWRWATSSRFLILRTSGKSTHISFIKQKYTHIFTYIIWFMYTQGKKALAGFVQDTMWEDTKHPTLSLEFYS